MISDFRSGLAFWWRGWGFIFKHRSLTAVAFFPFLLSVLFTAGFLWIMVNYLGLWVHQLVSSMIGLASGFWYDLAYYPLVIGGGLVVFIASLYVAFLLHVGLAVPFYSLLAERTLTKLGKKPQQSWRTTLRMFKSGMVKAAIFLLIGLVLFGFSFVPLLNVLAIACALLIMAFDCMDYSFECMGLGLRQRFAYLGRERAQWFGMAAGLALTLLVPGLTLLVTPGAVVGSALILKEPK